MATVLTVPHTDPSGIFETFRGNFATELLTAAVAHLDVFGRLGAGHLTFEDLADRLNLKRRPATVLICALRSFGLVESDGHGRLKATATALEHLTPGGAHYVGDYIALAAASPGVTEMVQRLRTDKPEGVDDKGAAFIFREGIESAMEQEQAARTLTLALAGRARNVAPVLAERFPLDAKVLLDAGGGTGLYSIAYLQQQKDLRAIVWDRPEVLKVAAELARSHGVADRLECRTGDMFRDPVPQADAVLLSNVLHDWDVPECEALVGRLAAALPAGGAMLIHDVFLNDELDGPLPIALYSAALFRLTEGRAYSAAEYAGWMRGAGLQVHPPVTTMVHCSVLPGRKV